MQSIASRNRRSENSNHSLIGKKPDAILALNTNNTKYELLYVECSRILCNSQKQDDDSVKLWRVCNDGMSWVWKSCKPARNQFGVVGIQIYGL